MRQIYNFVDMRLVLVLLATFLQSLFNLFYDKTFSFVRIVQLSPTTNVASCRIKPTSCDVDECREEEIADLDFGVYHGHDSHGSRFIIMITDPL